MEQTTGQLVEHLFRTEAGKLVATLTKIFGVSNIQLAEDVVQETLIAALDNWSTKGIPDNPSAWLMQVAKRKVLNEFKRNRVKQKYNTSHSAFPNYYDQQFDEFFLEKEIEDSQLKMIFACCNPILNTESQIALTLKTLCGFGVKEVANALLTSESTINKRLYRAKKTIRDSHSPFDIPSGGNLIKRLNSVCLTLYLMFNEGYNTTIGPSIIKKELCNEAMRLTKLLTDYFEENTELYALLALMCFQASRFDARIDEEGTLIIFEEQDRKIWNTDLIRSGFHYLHKSSRGDSLSRFHLEAGIAAEHCLAKSLDETNWQSIYEQYTLLYKLRPNAIVRLNLAIIQSKLTGEMDSLIVLDELAKGKELNHYYLLPATQGIFYLKLGQYEKAVSYFRKAIQLSNSVIGKAFLERKIKECQKKCK